MEWILAVTIFLANGNDYSFELGRFSAEEQCRTELNAVRAQIEQVDRETLVPECIQSTDT